MKRWFELHVSSIEHRGHALALLSCLLPYKRRDRVYGRGEKQLTAIVARAWGIGTSRLQALQKLGDNEHIDYASAVMRVVAESGYGTTHMGELVAWNDRVQGITPLYRIRQHVTREGRRLGCAEDSPPDLDEHLMIIFHDVLLWDEHKCIDESYTQRRAYLRDVVHLVPGHVEIGEQIVMDFTASDGGTRLAHQMAFAVAQQWEGKVLKACHVPYIGAGGSVARHVKLKKDYIPGLGDSADLAIIGGRCDPLTAHSLGLAPGLWTTLFLACRETGCRCHTEGVITCFRIVGQVSPPSVSMPDIRFLNAYGRLSQMLFSGQKDSVHIITELKGAALPTHLSAQPAVAEVIGAGFDRPADARYSTLRFPRIMKIHHGRGLDDVVDFTAYQCMAQTSREMADNNDDLSDYHAWLVKLGHGHADSESEAVTTSRASEVEDSALPNEHSQHVHVASVIGKKRQASAVSPPSDTAKRQRRARTETVELDGARACGNAETCPMEIPDSQPDAEGSEPEAIQEAQSEAVENAGFHDEKESEPLRRLGTLLVWETEKESLSPASYAAFAHLIISCRLDVTFDEERFWSSVTEWSGSTSLDRRVLQRCHLVLVGRYDQSVPTTAADFMLYALKDRRSVLETYPPCRVDFIAWDVLEDVCGKNPDCEDPWAVNASATVIMSHGTYSFTARAC
ncbi:hypothetical protein LTR51_008667 [Lithohypha guttulata]|nr:hypothetical protein LTR51_008667 [Lithohypha guttulata]